MIPLLRIDAKYIDMFRGHYMKCSYESTGDYNYIIKLRCVVPRSNDNNMCISFHKVMSKLTVDRLTG